MKKPCFANIGSALAIAIFFLLTLPAPGRADVLGLTYTVTPDGGGLYLYNFQLTLTNNDNTWASGQGWAYIVFGDCTYPCSSPLTNWSGISVDSPYSGFTYSSGGHNGPVLDPVFTYWVPTSVGDTLNWSGTSTADLGQGELLFSSPFTENGAEVAVFQIANDLSTVPEPGTLALLGAGLLGIGLLVRRKRGWHCDSATS